MHASSTGASVRSHGSSDSVAAAGVAMESFDFAEEACHRLAASRGASRGEGTVVGGAPRPTGSPFLRISRVRLPYHQSFRVVTRPCLRCDLRQGAARLARS